jgi:hypothetical protein
LLDDFRFVVYHQDDFIHALLHQPSFTRDPRDMRVLRVAVTVMAAHVRRVQPPQYLVKCRWHTCAPASSPRGRPQWAITERYHRLPPNDQAHLLAVSASELPVRWSALLAMFFRFLPCNNSVNNPGFVELALRIDLIKGLAKIFLKWIFFISKDVL